METLPNSQPSSQPLDPNRSEYVQPGEVKWFQLPDQERPILFQLWKKIIYLNGAPYDMEDVWRSVPTIEPDSTMKIELPSQESQQTC